MIILEANISDAALSFLNVVLKEQHTYTGANEVIRTTTGILDFFENESAYVAFKTAALPPFSQVMETDRGEYGDFQTPFSLAEAVLQLLATHESTPEVIIEPTCGKGNFLLAALHTYPALEVLIGVEIYAPYVLEAKCKVVDFFLTHPERVRPAIQIVQANVFEYNFSALARQYTQKQILLVGNPPWVTNAALGKLEANNLPQKRNVKKHEGLDAVTGKSNFDIGESILLSLIHAFQNTQTHIGILVKNTVVKNIVFGQQQSKYPLSNLQRYAIDAKRAFNVAVEASLFVGSLQGAVEKTCKVIDFYTQQPQQTFGWVNNKFVSDIAKYGHVQTIDGHCPYEWRQGVKHDCSAVMELEKSNGHYVNALQQEICLEETLVYGLLKSADLKGNIVDKSRKYTIVTQRKIGQDTHYIQRQYPKTYAYLLQHKALFAGRKSSIYQDKPPFSIFGIGEYSFLPYKIAISGLYKTFHFTLLLPQEEKPLMLDDTCYLIGFNDLQSAAYTFLLLNHPKTQAFLESISFSDAKRTFTKDVLMRIDLEQLAQIVEYTYIENALKHLCEQHGLHLTLQEWSVYVQSLSKKSQLTLF